MSLKSELLLEEADRLIFRAERRAANCREYALRLEQKSLDANDARTRVRRAESELKRLHLYRRILLNANSADALMPEYVMARGLVRMQPRRGASLLRAVQEQRA